MNIYAIQDDLGFVKIGITSRHPDTRLEAMATGNAKGLTLIGFGTHDGAAFLEEQLHCTLAFSGLHERGEWFKPSLITTCVANAISVDCLDEAATIAYEWAEMGNFDPERLSKTGLAAKAQQWRRRVEDGLSRTHS